MDTSATDARPFDEPLPKNVTTSPALSLESWAEHVRQLCRGEVPRLPLGTYVRWWRAGYSPLQAVEFAIQVAEEKER